MKRVALLLLAMLLSVQLAGRAGEPAPYLQDIRVVPEKPEVQEDDEPILPSAVNAGARVSDPALLCPAGAVWFFAVPDAARLATDWEKSPPGGLMAEPAMIRMFRNNRFGLNFLFADLPESIISPERVEASASALELALIFARMAEKMAMATYIGEDGHFKFLFLFDIGLDRIPAFNVMTEWETTFFMQNPGSDVKRGDHSGNFLDVWNLKKLSANPATGEIAAGFAENMAIVTNDAKLAADSLALLGGGSHLADSTWGRRLAMSIPASSTADLVGFIRMDALLKGLENTPIVRGSVAAWADYLGYGGENGEAMYYGLQFLEDGTRETFLLPTSSEGVSASLIELVAKRLKRVEQWSAPSVIPYQPNPALYFAAMLEGRQLGGILRQDRKLFGASSGAADFVVPPAVRPLFTNELVSLLTGEVGIAFFPSTEEQGSWLMVLPTTGNPNPLLPQVDNTTERNSVTVHSRDANWRVSPCWAAITPENFRRLSGNFLVVASDGDLLTYTLDQLLSGSTFSANKDFFRAMSQAEAGQGMVLYINVPEIVVRQYPNLSHIMRMVYPRSSGLNSRPPLLLLRRFAKGAMCVVAPANGANGGFTRVTVQAPLPTLGALGAGTVLGFPMRLRAEGRAAMAKSRENMKELWLKLQLYSSRFGHFPDTLDDLRADMRMNMSAEEIQAMFTAPAAAARLGPAVAGVESYRYLSGVTPNDEPDVPLLYEAEPWSDDFAGMYPTNPNRAPSETGDYQSYRQYIRLDGQIVAMPEKRFQDRVATRMAERE